MALAARIDFDGFAMVHAATNTTQYIRVKHKGVSVKNLGRDATGAVAPTNIILVLGQHPDRTDEEGGVPRDVPAELTVGTAYGAIPAEFAGYAASRKNKIILAPGEYVLLPDQEMRPWGGFVVIKDSASASSDPMFQMLSAGTPPRM